jgi:hypothetical protein
MTTGRTSGCCGQTEARLAVILTNCHGAILAHHRSKRIATLVTRDKAAFPIAIGHENGRNATTSKPGPMAALRPGQPR